MYTDHPDQFQIWFDQQEEETHEFVAGRLALRCLPALCDILGADAEPDHATYLRSKRLTLTLCVALADRRPRHISLLNKTAKSFLVDHQQIFNGESRRFLKKRGTHSIRCVSQAAHIFLDTRGKDWAVWKAQQECARACVLDTNFSDVYENWFSKSMYQEILDDSRHRSFEEPLWSRLNTSERDPLKAILDQWSRTSTVNSFWHDWYRGFFEGKPLDWELQRRVALIDDALWKNGPSAVTIEIEKIRAKFNLEKRVEELEAELRNATINRHGVGGNMPPEPINDASIAKELVIIWQPLGNLKAEIAKDKPSSTRLQQLVEALSRALSTGIAWCLKKVDLTVDTAIKWALPAGGGYLALNPEKLEAVIEATKKLLGNL
ncbi:MAG: hypothetical protein AAGL89_01960 [Pseudomonadota bacterium]